MDYHYDIAFALANKSVCLFTGAGFSKQLTGNKIPGWTELLESLCAYLNDAAVARSQLIECKAAGLPLEDCAQVIELSFIREGKDFRGAIAEIVKAFSVDVVQGKHITDFIRSHTSLKVISTNYDDLIQRFILPDKCNTNFPGKPITQRDSALEIFQVHGSVEHPPGIVATTEDYYRFINAPTYFSRKIFTLMSENTTVFLGYALGDSNLKAVIHAYRTASQGAFSRGALFYVTRKHVPQYIKDHYEMAFGLFVIDQCSIDDFLLRVQAKWPEAEQKVKTAETDLKNVLAGTHHYQDSYLRLAQALPHIVSVAHKTGRSIQSSPFIKLLQALLEKKISFSGEKGAWEQYTYLAQWLVYLGSMIEIPGTALEQPFLKAVAHSMSSMSETRRMGYSWAAFAVWSRDWGSVMFRNRQLIASHVHRELASDADAMKIISS
jgi:hypothetical protein